MIRNLVRNLKESDFPSYVGSRLSSRLGGIFGAGASTGLSPNCLNVDRSAKRMRGVPALYFIQALCLPRVGVSKCLTGMSFCGLLTGPLVEASG